MTIDGITPNDIITVTLQAVDTLGTLITRGGEWFMITIENECERSTTSFDCVSVSGQETSIITPVTTQMADNNDGTYSHTFTTDADGAVTYYIMYYDQTLNGIRGEYYPSSDIHYVGDYDEVKTHTNMNHFWGPGTIYGTRDDDVLVKLFALFRVDATQTYKFQ